MIKKFILSILFLMFLLPQSIHGAWCDTNQWAVVYNQEIYAMKDLSISSLYGIVLQFPLYKSKLFEKHSRFYHHQFYSMPPDCHERYIQGFADLKPLTLWDIRWFDMVGIFINITIFPFLFWLWAHHRSKQKKKNK